MFYMKSEESESLQHCDELRIMGGALWTLRAWSQIFLQNSFQSFNYPDSNLEQFFLIEERGYSETLFQ